MDIGFKVRHGNPSIMSALYGIIVTGAFALLTALAACALVGFVLYGMYAMWLLIWV